MRVRRALALSLVPLWLVLFALYVPAWAQDGEAGDGIPANCEWGDLAARDVFARYEPQNTRLVLVSWSSGADVRVLGENLPDTRVLGWSASCRYLAAAVGSVDSIDTVVWDTATSAEIGRVADAHGQPHAITWGPADFLMVETRNGAVLWNVPANTQTVLTTAFDPNSVRNFTRLRWDADALQVTANQVDGQRVVYDLTTGQAIPVAASAIESQALEPDEPRLIIGGHSYDCDVNNRLGNEISPVRGYDTDGWLYAELHPDMGTLVLVDRGGSYAPRNAETILVLDSGLEASWFQNRGISGCRYLIGSLGRVGEDVSDTVVWDLITGQRVGVFPDARDVPHRIWRGGDSLIVETRNGGFLWHLPTDTKTLLSSEVRYGGRGYGRGARNFVYVVWDTARGLVFTWALGTNYSNDPPTAYNSTTGERVDAEWTRPVYGHRFTTTTRPTQTLLPTTPVDGQSGWGTYRWEEGSERYDHLILPANRNQSSYDESSPEQDRDRVIQIALHSTGEVLTEFYNPFRTQSLAYVSWSPDGLWAFVRGTTGAYIWNQGQGSVLLYSDDQPNTLEFTGGAIQSFAIPYWDFERGQLIIATWRGASAFDLRTGARRYEFYAVPDPLNGQTRTQNEAPRTRITGNYLTVSEYGIYNQGIWNLDTMEVTYSTFPPVQDNTGE